MSRRRRVIHKEEKLDSRYGSPVVARMIATIMKSGKKSLAERIVYAAIEKTSQNSETVDPLETHRQARQYKTLPHSPHRSPQGTSFSPSGYQPKFSKPRLSPRENAQHRYCCAH